MACQGAQLERRFRIQSQSPGQASNTDWEIRRKDANETVKVICVDEREKVITEVKKSGAQDLIRELYSFDSVTLWPFTKNEFAASSYSTFPSSVLTLILALAMGALGSTIFVTGWFLKELSAAGSQETSDSRSRSLRLSILGWVIFRPVLGMVTAVGVFVAYKAGQITLSGSTASSTEIEVNPFLLAFFAIIAGLASESAISKLTEIADGAFGNKSGPQTDSGPVKAVDHPADSFTARKAEVALAASGRTIGAVAADLGMPSDTDRVERWIKGTEPVPAPMITAFATALGTTPGEVLG
jgi:hypothetical protein